MYILQTSVDSCMQLGSFHIIINHSIYQGVKNEAEEYMLKELSLLKWQEKATKLASENNINEIADIQEAISSLEANVKSER